MSKPIVKTFYVKSPDKHVYIFTNSREGCKKFATSEGQCTKYIKKNYRGGIEDHGRLYNGQKDLTDYEKELLKGWSKFYYIYKYRPMSGQFDFKPVSLPW